MNKNLIIIIPAKLRSKRLKNKNLLTIRGLPMFVYVAKEAMKSVNNPTIFVSSESKKIKEICLKYKINFISRPNKLSIKDTPKQKVIVHATTYITKKNKIKPKIIVSLQCNSPEFSHKDLDRAIELFKKKFKNKPIKELITVGLNSCQNAAFRIMTYETVFHKSLSANVIVFFTNYIDIHTKTDFNKVKKKLS